MNYKTVIGLEIHVQLNTKSKMFCGCDNNAENAAPNTLVCPVCLGMPGVLPVANKQAIERTLKTGLALNAQISPDAKFDRKHYYYPDLPKNYQISQYDMPFVLGGYLEIQNENGVSKKINLIRIHLEEDAGKLIHNGVASLIDLNRAGTPLMEIVTAPEISSPYEAKIFMQELRSLLRYLSVSEANMEKGHLRCDANISLYEIKSEKSKVKNEELGTPVEIKNLNSFRMVERALLYEEKRQRELLSAGEKISKETRGWNDQKGETYSQRSKEIAEDYRYFPEPDLAPFKVNKLFDINKLNVELPELPAAKRTRYVNEWKIKAQDAQILAEDQQMADYFEKVAQNIQPQLAANWVINELKMDGLLIISPENLIQLLEYLTGNVISNVLAKAILKEMIESGKTAAEIIKTKNITPIGDEKEIDDIIDKIIFENPKIIADIKTGKVQAKGVLVGLAMKESRGRANPQVVNKLINERLK